MSRSISNWFNFIHVYIERSGRSNRSKTARYVPSNRRRRVQRIQRTEKKIFSPNSSRISSRWKYYSEKFSKINIIISDSVIFLRSHSNTELNKLPPVYDVARVLGSTTPLDRSDRNDRAINVRINLYEICSLKSWPYPYIHKTRVFKPNAFRNAKQIVWTKLLCFIKQTNV